MVAMLDVDHFKRFNDTHGHAAGDKALQAVAEILRSAGRRSDVVARYGGEEILMVFPGADIRSGMEKLDETRVNQGFKRGVAVRLVAYVDAEAVFPGLFELVPHQRD